MSAAIVVEYVDEQGQECTIARSSGKDQLDAMGLGSLFGAAFLLIEWDVGPKHLFLEGMLEAMCLDDRDVEKLLEYLDGSTG